jgi:intein/homing endonuclease
MENNLIKPIEDVKEGEYVLTKETEFSNKLVKARITKKINNTVNEYLEIKLENKKKIRVTSFHPFFINDKWVKIGEAVSGDYLLDKKGEPIKIIDIKPVFKTAHIYNLKVEKYHTYFAEGIYVHNK